MTDALLSNFKTQVSDQEAVIALQVYLELTEIKRYHNVSHLHCPELKKIILTGNKKPENPTSAFVPVTVYEDLSFNKIQFILSKVKYSLVYLAIVHADSTCVYYQIANGLMEPTEARAKGFSEKKEKVLDKIVEKNRKRIEDAAMLGVAVRLDKGEKCEDSAHDDYDS